LRRPFFLAISGSPLCCNRRRGDELSGPGNGVVVFDEPVQLADGTEVRIEPIGGGESLPRVGPTLLKQLGDVVGSVLDLPTPLPCSWEAGHGRGLCRAPPERAAKPDLFLGGTDLRFAGLFLAIFGAV